MQGAKINEKYENNQKISHMYLEKCAWHSHTCYHVRIEWLPQGITQNKEDQKSHIHRSFLIKPKNSNYAAY